MFDHKSLFLMFQYLDVNSFIAKVTDYLEQLTDFQFKIFILKKFYIRKLKDNFQNCDETRLQYYIDLYKCCNTYLQTLHSIMEHINEKDDYHFEKALTDVYTSETVFSILDTITKCTRDMSKSEKDFLEYNLKTLTQFDYEEYFQE